MNIVMTSVSAIALAAATFGLYAVTQDEETPGNAAGLSAATDLDTAPADAMSGDFIPDPSASLLVPHDQDVLPDEATVTVNGEAVPHAIWHAMVMPGESLQFEMNMPGEVRLDGERIGDGMDTSWAAPETPGVHDLRIEAANGDAFRISIFVLQPLEGRTVLEGYRIGTYPSNAPEGLIRLTQSDMDTPISPSFMIGQFICKQQPGHWPKFLLVSSKMLVRLEALLDELREDELTQADSFFIMSGYRTPFYNTAIGSARLSRHMYGDASDIYPDVEGGDGVMDDLNGDGRVTRADAEFLYDYSSRLFTSRDDIPAGGIGAYGANAVHGPFIHIDGRGHVARWGRNRS